MTVQSKASLSDRPCPCFGRPRSISFNLPQEDGAQRNPSKAPLTSALESRASEPSAGTSRHRLNFLKVFASLLVRSTWGSLDLSVKLASPASALSHLGFSCQQSRNSAASAFQVRVCLGCFWAAGEVAAALTPFTVDMGMISVTRSQEPRYWRTITYQRTAARTVLHIPLCPEIAFSAA